MVTMNVRNAEKLTSKLTANELAFAKALWLLPKAVLSGSPVGLTDRKGKFVIPKPVGIRDNGRGFTQWHLQKVQSLDKCLCAIALKPLL